MTPLQCYKCGHYLGPDGYPDVFLVDGVYEEGYTLCGPCGRAEGYPDRRKEEECQAVYHPDSRT
jgi:hypothetical protein